MTNSTIQKLKALSVVDVATRLKLSPKRYQYGSTYMCKCFIHDDDHASLGFSISRNMWKCFVCNVGGGPIELVMKHENIQFIDACKWLIKEFNITETDAYKQQSRNKHHHNFNKTTIMTNSSTSYVNVPTPETNDVQYLNTSLIAQYSSINSTFCKALVDCGILTTDQMRHAAEAYRLGAIQDGRVIFWSIDLHNNLCEGKVMAYEGDARRSHNINPTTMSYLFKSCTPPQLPSSWHGTNCLFGLHLLKGNEQEKKNVVVAIVESEKTAVICSELIPTHNNGKSRTVWLATGGLSSLSIERLMPLKGYKIILFPDTDLDGSTYEKWLAIANQAHKVLGHPVTVSNVLEVNANDAQKARKIDIADFLME